MVKLKPFICPCCGQVYEGLLLCFGSEFPDYYYSVPQNERDTRIEKDESWCVVDNSHFFHRVRLEIPIIDYHENLLFNIWTSISEDNFGRRMDLWSDPERINEPPYFGWLQNKIPGYGDTLNIKTLARETGIGTIPALEVLEENHPLRLAQLNGITYARAEEIVSGILKEQHNK